MCGRSWTHYIIEGNTHGGLVLSPWVLYTFAPFVLGQNLSSIPMQTVFSKPEETRGDWYLVDAAGQTLGRLASQIAHRLKGKHKPNYAPHQDLGRPHRRHQCRHGPRHGRQAHRQVVPPAHRLRRQSEEHRARQAAAGAPRARPGVRGQGHAAERACSAAACTRSCTCSAATHIPIKHSSRRRWRFKRRKSINGIKLRHEQLLRHRPPQDLERARLPLQGHRQGRHQRAPDRRVLRARDRPDDRSAALRRRAVGRQVRRDPPTWKAAASRARPARSATASRVP